MQSTGAYNVRGAYYTMSTLTEEQFNAEIEMGMQDVNAGRIISAQSVAERMNQEYGI